VGFFKPSFLFNIKMVTKKLRINNLMRVIYSTKKDDPFVVSELCYGSNNNIMKIKIYIYEKKE